MRARVLLYILYNNIFTVLANNKNAQRDLLTIRTPVVFGVINLDREIFALCPSDRFLFRFPPQYIITYGVYARKSRVYQSAVERVRPRLHRASLHAASWRIHRLLVHSLSVIVFTSQLADRELSASKVE